MTKKLAGWTAQQQLAIDTRRREILVTASAGTGKTAVLSARCVDILADETDPTDVSQILVVTFTDAAAEEMRSRIAGQLRRRFLATGQPRLKHQLLMLDAAHISTIHSFCKRIITEHFHRLDIDCAFNIMEPDEQLLLKSQLLDEVIETAWGEPALAEGLAKLLDNRRVGRGDADFLNNIIAISSFLDSVPSREAFYERTRLLTDMSTTAASELAQAQKQLIARKLARCRSQLECAQFLDRKLIPPGHWSGQIQQAFIEPVNHCMKLLENDCIDDLGRYVFEFKAPRFINRPKEVSSETADLIKAPAKKAIATFKGLAELALINPDYERLAAGSVSLQTRVLIELVQRFDRRYAQAKRQINRLDFADLERLMFRLLEENADIREKLKERFKYIFVDEYQDINTLQQGIISALSSGDNVFVVGDVKQSIYGFRQSRCEIFLDRLANAVDDPGKSGALRVDLSDNFRSRKAILDFANVVFSRIMISSVATIDYDERAHLTEGFKYEPARTGIRGHPVEMYILDEQPDDEEDESPDEREDTKEPSGETATIIGPGQRQAAFIARRIRQMVGADTGKAEFAVYDKTINGYRDVQYGDIVILMRSLANCANEYVEMLRLAGVPVNSQSSAGYFATTEITDAVCLLKVLDNPQQDIELAALLRSPFFRITDTELAMIRRYTCPERHTGSNKSFFDCLVRYAEAGPNRRLGARAAAVLERLQEWRKAAHKEPLADLLWRIFRQTGYLSFVSALPNGRQRKANLEKLHDRAIQFAGFAGPQTTSLARFVEYIEKLLARKGDWAPATPETGADNAVSIISIHKSKGLEFPVVFLAELGHGFNITDASADCLVDDPETIGIRIIEPTGRVKLSSMAHQVISEKKRDQTIAEEMRLLYVAITRARERLVLTASRKLAPCREILTTASAMGDGQPRDWQLRSVNCSFDWLMYALADNRRMLEAFGMDSTGAGGGELLSVEIIQRGQLDAISDEIMRKRQSRLKRTSAAKTAGISKKALDLLDEIGSSIRRRYPYADVTKIAAKQSVSELTHPDDEFAQPDISGAFQRLPRAVSAAHTGAGGTTDARAAGTATHLLIQHVDLSAEITTAALRAAAGQLVENGLLSPSAAAMIDFASIVAFFQSDLGQTACRHRDVLLREWPFTLAVDARRLGAESAGETIVVQGIVDMIVPTPRGLIVIDFKTDNVTSETLDQRKELYAGQIRCYAQAAGAILRRDVLSAWLYFLKPQLAAQVQLQ